MSSLRELELERQLKEGSKGSLREPHKETEFQWTQKELDTAWNKISEPILRLAVIFANLPDSLEAADAAQSALRILDIQTDFKTLPPEKYLEFCRQLRRLWDNCDKTTWDATVEKREPVVDPETQQILNRWWLEHDLYRRERWVVHFPTGKFFPTIFNFHALFARVLFDKWTHLGICGNKDCPSKYFVKPLRTSKLCKNCNAYGNRKRQAELRDRRKQAKQAAMQDIKSAQKSRKRA
jgi:hypothetical protein